MALTIDQQIEEIKREIRKTPYHKGTEHHIGKLKARIAKLKAKKEAAAARGSSGRSISYAVKKQGDATIVLIGPPSVGKSTLINKLTNSQSKVAPYAFTTVSVIPGMMVHKNARVQLLDVPGLIEGAAEGKGRGREVLSVARGADLLIIITDPEKINLIEKIKTSLEENGIRIDKNPPKVKVEKKSKGGLVVRTNIKQDLDIETIKDVAKEFGFGNAEVSVNEKLSMDTLVDAFARNRVYVPSLTVINKSDLDKPKHKNAIYISAEKGEGLDKLKDTMLDNLGLITVYLIKPGKKPNEDEPMIMKEGQTIADVAKKISTEFAEEVETAQIWGPGAKFPAQKISLKEKLKDGMQIRFN